MIVVLQELHETQGSQTKFHAIKYINIIYIYLSLLIYNSSIPDIEHSSYHIALDSPQTYKLILWKPTVL